MVDETSGGILGGVEQIGADIAAGAEAAVTEVKTEVAKVLAGAEQDVVAALGHVHNLLENFKATAEVGTVRSAIEAALVSVAKRIGG